MKLSELATPAEPVVAEPEATEEPQFVTETTPSGLEILYQWAPKRLYRLGYFADPTGFKVWQEVPSVTTVLGVLDKSGALTWWGMKVGVQGVLDLIEQNVLVGREEMGLLHRWEQDGLNNVQEINDAQQIVELLTEHKLTVNHVRDSAADRGVNVHNALESWVHTSQIAPPEEWPEHERGYVDGLRAFLHTIDDCSSGVQAEIMVGSLEHLYAGRYDLRLTLTEPVELVTRTYPKKKDKVETVPAGRYLLDLKTSKRVYDTHFLQLEAYERASVECGYEPTDYRGVLHVTADGAYELQVNNEWTFEDFAQVRKCYAVMNERAKLKGEREVESVLRDELGAKTVTKDAA